MTPDIMQYTIFGFKNGSFMLTFTSSFPNTSRLDTYATLPITSAATPSSSLLTSIFIVTPVFALNAILIVAATLPPVIVFP